MALDERSQWADFAIGSIPDRGSSRSSALEVYDPVRDTWTLKADMPTPRWYLGASAVNGKVYAIGGERKAVVFSSVETYDTGAGIRVQAISPKTALVDGGELIVISFRSSFLPDAVVTIGGNPLTNQKVADNLITGLIPPGTAGERALLITSASAAISDLFYSDQFVYVTTATPVVTEMTPTNGRQEGGETGSITGSGFLPGITVLIGNSSAIDVVPTSTLLTFTIPPGAEDAQDVIITNPGGEQVTIPRSYPYNPFPTIERVRGIVPDEGRLAGGTQVTITGANFTADTVVVTGMRKFFI